MCPSTHIKKDPIVVVSLKRHGLYRLDERDPIISHCLCKMLFLPGECLNSLREQGVLTIMQDDAKLVPHAASEVVSEFAIAD